MSKEYLNKLDKIGEIDELEPLEEVPVPKNSVDTILNKKDKYSYLLLSSEDLKAVYKTKFILGKQFAWVLITNKRIIRVQMPERVVEYDLIDQIDYLRMNQEKCWVSYGTNTIEFDTEKETIDFYRCLLPFVLK